MISYDEALRQILAMPFALGSESVPLLEAGGRYLAGPVAAPWPLPRFDNSAMDGYAVRCADFGDGERVVLPIAGESAAGHPFNSPIPSESAIRISTGAVVPPGADGIIPVEKTVLEGDGRVCLMEKPVPGRFIRRRGEDVTEGASLFGRGTRLDPATLAFLAMFNLPRLEVLARPRVAIFSSGDEVKLHGEPLRESDIVGVNMYYLVEKLNGLGCETRLFGIAPDDKAAFLKLIESALGWADVLVSTAGVSVGEHDVVGAAMKELSAGVLFWKVAVRPGKPMLVATIAGKPYFGLPGNPVSVCCNTEIFLKPFLRQAFGCVPAVAIPERMRLACDCPRDKARLFFVHARSWVDDRGERMVESLPNQSSGNLYNPARSNALIVVEPGEGSIPAGEMVRVIPT